MFSRFATIIVIALFCSMNAAVAGSISEGDLHFFESKIRPALIEHCYECHSEEADKRKGGLWLDRRAGWQVGGDSGPAAIPGDLDGSLLIETIRYVDPDLEMPPEGKMPESVIADFEEWVRRGLPDPRNEPSEELNEGGLSIEEGKEFWSFRERQVEFGKKNSIDDFIDAKLVEVGLDAAPAATPEQRLRRARVDLTGFIPTVEEQEEFLSDPSREKWTELIDRWMATAEFGERWGRHWLDLARYADTSGGGRAMAFREAWRFRDFVIDSFSQDRPLDELIRLQIAGDLLPYRDLKQRQENLIATGFLVLGPHNYENQNKDELEMEIVDEQLDTIGRAFLGQTIGCARCHDHKFDPIPTKDYYALAGIFKSTDFVTHANVSKWHTEPIPPTREAQLAIAEYERESSELEKEIKTYKDALAEMGRGTGGRMKSVPAMSLPGIVVDDTEAEKIGEWQESTHSGRWIGAGYIHDRNEHRSQKAVIFRAKVERPGRYELRVSYSSGPSRNTKTPIEVRIGEEVHVSTINQKLDPEHDDLFQTVGVFEIPTGASPQVTISNRSEENGHIIVDAIQWLPENFEDREEDGVSRQIAALENSLADAEKRLKKLKSGKPDIPTAMSVVDRGMEAIGDTELRIRGVEGNRGEAVPRGFLEVASWQKPEIPADASGRLELAQWLTDSNNPLTARVLANRIWLKLMGEGLVRTADNFGVTGEAPTHPELLDFLAQRLIDSEWSTRALVREIMLSDVYSRSSEFENSKALQVDPENKLYWKGHLRLLDAESMRDAMLRLSGTLDTRRGGASLPGDFKSEFGYEFTTMKRSIYVPVFRNSGHEMFNVFDFANPNFSMGRRARSTIPTQALYLTNSDFVHRRASEAASELLQESLDSDRERVVVAFRKTLGRTPKAKEVDLALRFLRESGDTAESDDAEAWSALQRALFASVDFRFLR